MLQPSMISDGTTDYILCLSQNQIRMDLSELEKVQELEMIKSKWMESEMKCKKVILVFLN